MISGSVRSQCIKSTYSQPHPWCNFTDFKEVTTGMSLACWIPPTHPLPCYFITSCQGPLEPHILWYCTLTTLHLNKVWDCFTHACPLDFLFLHMVTSSWMCKNHRWHCRLTLFTEHRYKLSLHTYSSACVTECAPVDLYTDDNLLIIKCE